MTPRYIIGIDPDCNKSGFAVFDQQTKVLSVKTCSFPDLLASLKAWKMFSGGSLLVVVEASWIHSKNWHTVGRDSLSIAARKGYAVGRNHQTGMLIVEVAKDLGIMVKEQPPYVKTWKGKDRKITHEEFICVTGCEAKRTNQEERDAGLLAFIEAGQPLVLRR